jgi:hypothetical protein
MDFRKVSFVLWASGLLLFACDKNIKQPEMGLQPAPVASLVHIYQGIFPCDDCDGTQVTLELDLEKQTYRLLTKQTGTYFGEQTSEKKGTLNTLRGFEEDENGTVYVLDDHLEEPTASYLRIDGQTLELLDAGQIRRVNPLEYRLSLATPQ